MWIGCPAATPAPRPITQRRYPTRTMSGPAVMADPAHHHMHLTPPLHWDGVFVAGNAHGLGDLLGGGLMKVILTFNYLPTLSTRTFRVRHRLFPAVVNPATQHAHLLGAPRVPHLMAQAGRSRAGAVDDGGRFGCRGSPKTALVSSSQIPRMTASNNQG